MPPKRPTKPPHGANSVSSGGPLPPMRSYPSGTSCPTPLASSLSFPSSLTTPTQQLDSTQPCPPISQWGNQGPSLWSGGSTEVVKQWSENGKNNNETITLLDGLTSALREQASEKE